MNNRLHWQISMVRMLWGTRPKVVKIGVCETRTKSTQTIQTFIWKIYHLVRLDFSRNPPNFKCLSEPLANANPHPDPRISEVHSYRFDDNFATEYSRSDGHGGVGNPYAGPPADPRAHSS